MGNYGEMYQNNPRSIAQATGIIDRFVNQIRRNDVIVVPDGSDIYLGTVRKEYFFDPKYATDDEGYPHRVEVEYEFDGQPIPREELSAIFYNALRDRQTVFGVPYQRVEEIICDPERFHTVAGPGNRGLMEEYAQALAHGRLPGVNSTRFEEAVQGVLSLYYPGLEKQATTAAPVGADTDLMARLPGDVCVRVQVKCYQDDWGELGEEVVDQLRASMDEGDHGIVVTTNKVSEGGRKRALEDPSKPVAIIDGRAFAELVLENLDRLDDELLGCLGLRKMFSLR